jgi:hypothetical protein
MRSARSNAAPLNEMVAATGAQLLEGEAAW